MSGIPVSMSSDLWFQEEYDIWFPVFPVAFRWREYYYGHWFERKVVMDVQQVAVYLGLSRSMIYKLIKLKQIPASRVDRQYRFLKAVIDKWVADKGLDYISKQEEQNHE